VIQSLLFRLDNASWDLCDLGVDLTNEKMKYKSEVPLAMASMESPFSPALLTQVEEPEAQPQQRPASQHYNLIPNKQ
jgi:hypothetical protein